jgi:SecD/SecF fusion protein
MHLFQIIPSLLAQVEKAAGPEATKVATNIASDTAFKLEDIVFVVWLIIAFALPFALAYWAAQTLRVPESRGKMSFILLTISLGLFTLFNGTMRLGIDLKGGVILIYQVDLEKSQGTAEPVDPDDPNGPADSAVAMNLDLGALCDQLTRRINPSGTQEIVVRPYGEDHVEIIIPDVNDVEIEIIKTKITSMGQLDFLIVANTRDHIDMIETAKRLAESNDPVRMSKKVTIGDAVQGRWVSAGRDTDEKNEISVGNDQHIMPFKIDLSPGQTIRNGDTGEILDIPSFNNSQDDDDHTLELYLHSQDIKDVQVLMAVDEERQVTGSDLSVVSAGMDGQMRPSVNFSMNSQGALKFGSLTNRNKPVGQHTRQLGIVLDEQLLSAPSIQSKISGRGQITGNFTREEVAFIVGILRAGRLPATLMKEPASENTVDAMLGKDTIDKGKFATGVSLVVIIIFISIYYRFAGVVACLALALNLLLIVAVMMIVKQPLTLPGLAGLVLTVGMSVDANVLIFERIREERAKGAAARMAIRNGFSRATTTIVDANLTTLITAFVLYAIGTAQIRGFAVTLILGIVLCMYTAIFCSRLVFDIWEKNRWLKEVKMYQLIGATNIDFVGKQLACAILSVVLIAGGLVAVYQRGSTILDIDFSGGVQVVMQLEEGMDDEDVRKILREKVGTLKHLDGVISEEGSSVDFTLNGYGIDKKDAGTVWKVDASLANEQDLKDILASAFDVASYTVEVGDITETVTVIEQPEEPEDPAFSAFPGTPVENPNVPKEPETTTPETTTPEATTPETTTPETTTPETTTPETTTPEATTPEATTPEATTPEATTPEATTPEATTPEATTPEATTPEATTPEATTPEATTPEATTPESESDPAPRDNSFLNSPRNGYLVAFAQDDVPPAATDTPEETDTPAETDTPEATDTPAATDTPEATDTPAATDTPEATDTPGSTDAIDETSAKKTSVESEAILTFEFPISSETLIALIEQAAEQTEIPIGRVGVVSKDESWQPGSSIALNEWEVVIPLNEEYTKVVLAEFESKLKASPVWLSSSQFGSKVAGDTRTTAAVALFASLIGIVGYIWVRFQKVVFGLAAVVALVHDVLITLGAIAVSAYVANFLGFLLIEEFKISLPIVAAFLTIIGYSLNDTIVVFDRIREVRGRSPELTSDMINVSINQTLSRTVLTSMTTLLVVVILYIGGGSGIHGFAFALVVGVVVGTYSSVFVASPILLWMAKGSADTTNAPKRSENLTV